MEEKLCSVCSAATQNSERATPSENEIIALADFFSLVASESRLKILLALDSGELCAGHLAEAVGMAPSAVSNQLKALRQARLISVRREGKMLFYSLADCHPRAIIHMAMSHIHEENHKRSCQ